VPTYLDDHYLLAEIQHQFRSVQYFIYNNSNIMLKRLSLNFIYIFTVLFNSFLTTSSFLHLFKNAKILFLSKTTPFSSSDEIRPISLLCVIDKLFEWIISRKLKLWMHNSAIIPSEQSGFQPKLRLPTRILTLTHSLSIDLENENLYEIKFPYRLLNNTMLNKNNRLYFKLPHIIVN
jgi:hypothetical protein